MRTLRYVLAGAVLAALIAGCGQSQLIASKSAQLVDQFVYSHFKLRVHASCPSGVPAKVGQTYTCSFQGPNGRYVANLTVLSVHGTAVENKISTHGPVS